MSILRKTQRVTFTTIENELLNDDRLSFRARGVAAFLMSKPDGWNIRQEFIVRQGTEGRDAIRTSMRELVEYGYAKIYKTQDEKGHWRTETRISDYPIFEEDTELLETSSPVTQGVGEPVPLVKTEVVNTEEIDISLGDPMNRMPKQRKEFQTALDHSMSAKRIGLTPEQFRIMTDAVLEVCGLTILVNGSDSPDATWQHNYAKDAAVFLAQLGYDANDVVDLGREWVKENDWKSDQVPKPKDLKAFASKGKSSPDSKKEYARAVARGGDLE